jgi:hypothetical protein
MVDDRTAPSTRQVLLHRLGGPPGGYAVATVVLAALWFPFRLWLDRGEPLGEIVAASGLSGAVWALFAPAVEWMQRHGVGRARRAETSPPAADGPDASALPMDRAWRRRGAHVGLAVGVPFFGGLGLACLRMGVETAYAVSFGMLLFVVVAIAVRSVRSTARKH